MATDDPTNTPTSPQIGGQVELTSLAQRLRARADSVLFRDQPVQQVDLHTAANAISELLRIRSEIRGLADEIHDEEAELALRQIIGGSV